LRNSGAPALGVREFVRSYSRLRGKSERKHCLTGLGERCDRRLSLYRLITGHFIAIMSKKDTHGNLQIENGFIIFKVISLLL